MRKLTALLIGLLLPFTFAAAQAPSAPVITSVVVSGGGGGGGGGGSPDTTPDAFSFTDQTAVGLSSTITSAAVAINGIETTITCTATGGTIDVEADGNFQASRNVANGEDIRARHTSSGSNSTATNTPVSCGGVSDTFTSTTEASGDPEAIYELSSTDTDRVPWHNGSGGWGAQVALEYPVPPTTSSTASVASVAALQAALGGTDADCDWGNTGSGAVSNIEITLTASVSASAVVCVWGDHVDIVYNDGIVGPSVHVKNTASNNIRVRGPTPGERGATPARFGQIRGDVSHIIVDGLDMNGNFGGSSGAETNQVFRLDGSDHVGIYRVRALAGGYCSIGAINHALFVDTNCMAGAMTNAQLFASGYASNATNGGVGKWAIRHTGGGPITCVRSDFRNTMFHTLRLHSTGAANELFAAVDCRFVAYAEAKLAWAWASGGTGDGVAFRDSELWAFSECGGWTEIQFTFGGSRTTNYGQIRGVTTYSEGDANYTVAYLNGIGSSLTSAGGTADIASNSAVDPWPTSPTTGPAWDMNSSGDPMSLPLPTGDTPSYGEAACTGGGTGWPYR